MLLSRLGVHLSEMDEGADCSETVDSLCGCLGIPRMLE